MIPKQLNNVIPNPQQRMRNLSANFPKHHLSFYHDDHQKDDGGFRDDYGVDVTHAWGMTETSPMGTIAQDRKSVV